MITIDHNTPLPIINISFTEILRIKRDKKKISKIYAIRSSKNTRINRKPKVLKTRLKLVTT
jgi:hypothetical protein